jgi:spermidine/putrescine transport system substrate-binding protein
MLINKSGLISFYLLRVVFVLIWLLIIFGFLYSPYFSRFFVSKNSINVYTWADVFDVKHAREFEAQTGIKVNLVYYDNCEELISKLEITKGSGYDLILLTDSNVAHLIKMDILAPINKSKLDFWQYLEPNLLHKDYDESNTYAIPYNWDVCGMGVNIENFGGQIPANSWRLIFDAKLGAYKIGMMEEGLRAVSIAAQYLYGNKLTKLDPSQMQAIKKLLITQKKMVEVYTELLGDYLLYSRSSPVVVTPAAYVQRIMASDKQIKFVMPKEGGFVVVENFVVLKSSTKQELTYKFLNFMYQKKVLREFVHKTMFLPPRTDILKEMNLDYLGGTAVLLDRASFAQMGYFKYIASREDISRLWIEVKAS